MLQVNLLRDEYDYSIEVHFKYKIGGDVMENFEGSWAEVQGPVSRYIRFRITNSQDAEDVFQEVMAAAALQYDKLSDPTRFKPWVLGIARHQCADWLRKKYRMNEVPLEAAEHLLIIPPRFAAARDSRVQEAMEALSAQDQQILGLYYWQQLPLCEIARRLSIPAGTVKSRLHHARERFRAAYSEQQKGETAMKTMMPKHMPEYKIVPSELAPFECKWEEMMGWFIIPRLGEKLSWAMYDLPDRTRTENNELIVTGRAQVHGIEGVEIEVRTDAPMEFNAVDDSGYVQRSFIAQLTQTHCRTLAETHMQDNVKQTYTFLDGDAFIKNWGFGEDNCGNETLLRAKGEILRCGDVLTTHSASDNPMDVVGRYTVAINGKVYDTVCVIMHETYMGGMVSEQFIDRNGRTVLWRRFNSDDWHFEHYGRKWSELLPDSDTLTINGQKYVHWYDCITSYIL